MNLYIIGWNLSKDHQATVLTELRRTSKIYPHLDPEKLWHRWTPCGTIFAASIHTVDQAAAPRNYVMQSDDQVVFYSGLPINPSGDYPAHRAEALSEHWDKLTESLDGMYFVARATDDPPCLELQTDILGFEQVYYLHQGDLWLISNSVRLIEQVSGSSTPDPLGVSLFLSIKWVGADRTLRSDIRVIPGGQRWTWQKGDIEPRRQTYYPVSRLARHPRQALAPSYIKRLAEDLTQPLRILGQNFPDDITCPLTGGRDSRLMATMVMHAEVPARSYTYGNPSGTDTETARRIAQTFDLPYEVIPVTAADIIKNWDQVCWQTVRQSDGMMPLQLLASAMAFLTRDFDRLDVRLSGVGGEIARAYFTSKGWHASFFLARHDVRSVQEFLAKQMISSHNGLIRQEAVKLTRDYILDFVAQRADDGFALRDIPDVFYAYQRVGRRGGSNMRRSMAIFDVFTPYCTRPWVEATFAISALKRTTQPLHNNIMRLLSPEMHEMPFNPVGTGPWPLQQPVLNLLKSYGSVKWRGMRRKFFKSQRPKRREGLPFIVRDNMFDRSSWFEAKREHVREICLDQSDSLLWSYVDRPLFDRITSSATDAAERARNMMALYHILTLFYYESDDR